MKFDVIVGNPPYQTWKDKEKHTIGGNVIWPKFVVLSLDICKQDGHVCLIHPAAWRIPNGRSKNVNKVILSNQLLYLEMHSMEDGMKTFRCTTNYDWYITKKNNVQINTIIKDYDGEMQTVNINELLFIPNRKINYILNLFSKSQDQRLSMLYQRNRYDHRKKWMNNIKDSEYIYPCVYYILKDNIRLMYSNTNKNGHFNIHKVIFTYGSSINVIADLKGEYGLTQFAFAIIDEPENLENIRKALMSKKFIEFCSNFKFQLSRYDHRFIRLLRKDFWKEFI